MGTLDALRTWAERHPDAGTEDWRVAQHRGWREDEDMPAVRAAARAGLPLTSVDAARLYGHQDAVRQAPIRSNQERVDHLTRPDGPARNLFIEQRPRADRLVYILLRELTELDADAGRAGHEWYERNRATLPVDRGSDFITRIRTKIAEVKSRPIEPVKVETPTRDVWAEWRTLAGELVARGNSTGARFAVDTQEGAVNKVAFWWIVPGKRDHAGKFFLRQVIGGQGPVRVRMSPEAMVSIARKIMAAGPSEAMLRYGREMGACGACGTELTNDESRALGIGPECRRKGRG